MPPFKATVTSYPRFDLTGSRETAAAIAESIAPNELLDYREGTVRQLTVDVEDRLAAVAIVRDGITRGLLGNPVIDRSEIIIEAIELSVPAETA